MVHRLTDGDVHYIAGVDEDDFAMSPRSGREFDTATLRFGYTSLKTPAAVYDYDMKTRDRVLRKQQEVPSGYDPGNTKRAAYGPARGTGPKCLSVC